MILAGSSVAEPQYFYAAPGKNFDSAPAPTLLYSNANFLKQTKVLKNVETTVSCSFDFARFI
jgi:hypothetical protein